MTSFFTIILLPAAATMWLCVSLSAFLVQASVASLTSAITILWGLIGARHRLRIDGLRLSGMFTSSRLRKITFQELHVSPNSADWMVAGLCERKTSGSCGCKTKYLINHFVSIKYRQLLSQRANLFFPN